MKILHLEFGRHVYGGALQVAYLMQGLTAYSEIENHLVCPRESDLPGHIPAPCGAEIHPIPVGGEFDVRVLFRLKRLIREIHPDIIHIHSRRGADFWGVLAARQCGIACLLTRRVDNADPSWLTRWRTKDAAFVVGISRRICEVMISRGTDPGKMHCILSTVDTDTYQPGGNRALLADASSSGDDALYVGIIAQLIERKGHRILFKAIPAILKRHPNTVFLIFGKGPLEKALRDEAAAESWSEHVRFMGFRTDIPQLLPALDLVVHPAFMEGLGVSLLQASACGVPIVACDAGGIPEVVEDGVNGLLVKPGDDRALAEAIAEILGNAPRRRKMGEVGREIAEKRFSVARMAREYTDLYRKTIKIP